VSYLIFSQRRAGDAFPVEEARASAARMAVRLERAPHPGHSEDPALSFVASAHGATATFRIECRGALPADLARAREAELRGRAAGMSDLAARCPTIWLVDSTADTPRWLVLELVAVLCATALGPALPPDGATLLGVRSARELAERLREG
jgi:hypothetical protein